MTQTDNLVWELDRRLVDLSTSFPFLVLVTATNDEEAFAAFQASGYHKEPTFTYRDLPIEPAKIKWELLDLPIDEVRDDTLAYILRDKRTETLEMLDMLAQRGTEAFRAGSLRVFGGVSPELLATAERLLTDYPAAPPRNPDDFVDATAFRTACTREFDYFKTQSATVEPDVIVRDDLVGLMVSQGVMHIGTRTRIPRNRLAAMIQHEVGTHVLTYWNGRAQPLTLLHTGTPGYEDLQEGIAVLSEWFEGELTANRMRILAARVVGIAHMLNGNSFTDTFALLHEHYGMSDRSAFFTTARIYRCGGFTKDAVYLRGLLELLEYLAGGGELEPLFVGKLRLSYAPILQDLRNRGILRPAPLQPRYFVEDRRAGHPKLNRLRAGMTVFDLVSSP